MLMPAATMAAAAAASGQACAATPAPAYACGPKDALIAWYKGEFAAANAIIDALCAHLAQIGGRSDSAPLSPSPSPSGGYQAVFAAVHRRRMNWIPVLQWQTYFSVADVVEQLRRVAEDQMLLKRSGARVGAQRQQWDVQNHAATVMEVDHDHHHGEETENDEVVEGRHGEIDRQDQIKVDRVEMVAESPTGCGATSSSDATFLFGDTAVDVVSNPEDAEGAAEQGSHEQEQAPTVEAAAEQLQQQDAEVEDDAMGVEEKQEVPSEPEQYPGPLEAATPADPVQIPDQRPSLSSDDDDARAEPSTEPRFAQPLPPLMPVASGIICAGRHDECDARRDRINVCKGFVAKENNKGRTVNIVKGLKVYEDAFNDSELAKLADCVCQLRDAGQNGLLSAETYIMYNKQLKGNKREIIQFGVPVFQPPTTDEATTNIEPIPQLLQDVIAHLILWRFIPATKKPNSCIINFYDEDDHSQPYFKPPHLDNPLSTLLLHQTTMAFGKALTCDNDGNYKGSLKLQLKEGSLVVMRGNSADMARHVICPSSNPRVSITFVKVRPTTANNPNQSVSSPTKSAAPPLNQPEQAMAGSPPRSFLPTWTPILMLAPARPIPMNAIAKRTNRRSGTGVFLPWALGSNKYIKHLPPRIQKRTLPALPQLEKPSQMRCLAMS